MARIALSVEYNGQDYNGFQKQSSTKNTVQYHLERALTRVADEPIGLVCAGRTDAGVHATEQIVHFDTLAKRPTKAWIQGVNAHLPDDIRVHWATELGPSFHARFSAISRTYRYVLYCADVKSASLGRQVTWTSYALDVKKMQSAAAFLQGEHDFTSYRATYCQARNPVRTISRIELNIRGPFIVMEVSANAFLHHMVRNIMGVLIEVGRGRKEPGWAKELLGLRDRTRGAPTASPDGLYLVRAGYPDTFELPCEPLGPIFLSY